MRLTIMLMQRLQLPGEPHFSIETGLCGSDDWPSARTRQACAALRDVEVVEQNKRVQAEISASLRFQDHACRVLQLGRLVVPAQTVVVIGLACRKAMP